MRTDLKIAVVLAATAVGGVGYRAIARSDDPAQIPGTAPDTDRKARHAAITAANDVARSSQATFGGRPRKVRGCCQEVCKRGSQTPGRRAKNDATRDHFSQFEKDWKSRYNQDFEARTLTSAR
jgi:hypothetical protein